MRFRHLLIAACGAATFGCGSATEPGGIGALAGYYKLSTIDAQELPFSITPADPNGIQVIDVGSTLTIARDSTYAWANTVRVINRAVSPPSDETRSSVENGSVRTNGGSAALYGAGVDPVSPTAGGVTVTAGGHVWLFVRQ